MERKDLLKIYRLLNNTEELIAEMEFTPEDYYDFAAIIFDNIEEVKELLKEE